MDQLNNGSSLFEKPSVTQLEQSRTQDLGAITKLKEAGIETKPLIQVNKGTTSGLADKTSKLSSQDRLSMQVKILGKSTLVSLAAINVALFTPIEFSFGKMTSLTLNAMVFCLNKFDEENKKTKNMLTQKNAKYKALKRAENFAKKCGALVGFTAMAILMGGVGSIAAGSSFSIYNSMKLQEDE